MAVLQQCDDAVLCYYCHVAHRRHLPVTLNKDDGFKSVGLTNWKKLLKGLTSTRSQYHIIKPFP